MIQSGGQILFTKDVVDNLDSTDSNLPLSANQGNYIMSQLRRINYYFFSIFRIWGVNEFSSLSSNQTKPFYYGYIIRVGGCSYPGYFEDDSYYIGVSSEGDLYNGVQINGATTVTFNKMARA